MPGSSTVVCHLFLNLIEERVETLLTMRLIMNKRHPGRVHGRAHRKSLGFLPQFWAGLGLLPEPMQTLGRRLALSAGTVIGLLECVVHEAPGRE